MVRCGDELEPLDGCPVDELNGFAGDLLLLPAEPDELNAGGRWLLDADELLVERPDALATGRLVFDAAGRLAFFEAAERAAGRELTLLLDFDPREVFDEADLSFFVEALREAVRFFDGDFARLVAAVDRPLLDLREADAERDFEAELRDATRDFGATRDFVLRPLLAPRLLDFFAAPREEAARPAEAFFELEPARARLDAPADFLDELPERPEDLEEPRFDAITTPFDVSALSERIDRSSTDSLQTEVLRSMQSSLQDSGLFENDYASNSSPRPSGSAVFEFLPPS